MISGLFVLVLFLTVVALVVVLAIAIFAPAKVTEPWIAVTYLSIASFALIIVYLVMALHC